MYQIYVRSWKDSNGDGIGDLPGVAQGLDYLTWLGVDGIWLSPTMPSPNTDWGYDVSDYLGVHPDLGTLDDMDRLIEQAGRRGIAVLLDLVPNHTSSAHPWFVDALTGRAAEHRNYYVWAPPRSDGAPPNNWVDATGASAWTLDPGSGEYYLHNFLPTQPDLNWWDERVHAEFERILHFWFKRGVAGFRIDVAHGLYKDKDLRDDPPARPSDHPAALRGGLRTTHSSHRPEVHDVYKRWRQVADSYDPPRVLLGETWEFDLFGLGDYYGRQAPELHLGFNFPFVFSELKAKELASTVESTLSALPAGSSAVWTASNHDLGRFATRWCQDDQRAVRAALVLLSTLPGTLVLYYGDELGMGNVDVGAEAQLDIMTKGRPANASRDRYRTPMPWGPDPLENYGFCPPDVRPWLPLGEHGTTNVQVERADDGSVLKLCHELIALRRSGQIAKGANVQRLLLDEEVWAFRVGEAITVANLSPAQAERELAVPGPLHVLCSTRPGATGTKAGPVLHLGPWEAAVLSWSGARPAYGN